MFCPQCGKKCPDDSRFCENCGSPIEAAPFPQSGPVPPVRDPLAGVASEIEETVRRAQAAPVQAPPQPIPMPMPAKKKFNAAFVIIPVAVLLLLAAAGGGAFFLFHTRSSNEAKLSENLMEYMWPNCEADITEYYDDVLPKSYSRRGYEIERRGSAFLLQPSQEKDVFQVQGRADVVDLTDDDEPSYRVDIQGTVKTNFMRTQYTWDLDFDFEEPPVRKPEDEAGTPDDTEDEPQGEPESGAQAPVQDVQTPGGASTAPGGSADSTQSTYLWPTDSQYITNADLDRFERKQIMLMRNELYARYGCTFQDEEIRTYFESQSWYTPNPDLLAIDFKREWFNDYETTNLDTILNYERAKGWRK